MAATKRKDTPYDPESFRQSFTIGSFTIPPDIFRNEPCCLGIDEAGRGPVSGPMVYGICYSPLSKSVELKKMGFADSKVLSENERDNLFEVIRKASECVGWTATILQPQDISSAMLRKSKYNLNDMSHDTAINLVQDALDRGVFVDEVYVDTVGDPGKYQTKLINRFPTIRKIVVSKKADALFPIVSAASICAKVTRDRILKSWIFEETNLIADTKFGSGYPHDPTTVEWLKVNFNKVFGFPSIVRFSWSTAARIIESDACTVIWPDEQTADPALAGVPSLFEFFGKSTNKRQAELDEAAAKRSKPTAANSLQIALKLERVHDF